VLLLLISLFAALPAPVPPAAERLEPETACLCAVPSSEVCMPNAATCVCITRGGWVSVSLQSHDARCEAPAPIAGGASASGVSRPGAGPGIRPGIRR